MIKQQLTLDGASYSICLPDAEIDSIQSKIAQDKQPYELEMLRDMAARLQPGDLVLDVGANIGNHTLYLVSVVGCRVHAFEPNKHLCDALAKSIALNGLEDRVTIHQVGVAASKGVARFSRLDPANLGGQSLEVTEATEEGGVVLLPIDDLDWSSPVRLIKIDVEGMEAEVLQGAEKLIRRDKPILYIESKTAEDFARLNARLQGLGYLYYATFNATPTHAFLHETTLSLSGDISRLLAEKALQLYAFKEESQGLQSKLHDCNLKYRDASERIKQLDEARDQAASKYREACTQIAALKLEIEKQRLHSQALQSEKHKISVTQTLKEERALLQLERQKNAYETERERWASYKEFSERETAALKEQLIQLKEQLDLVKGTLDKRSELLVQANEKYSQVTGLQIPQLKEQLAARASQLAEYQQRIEQQQQQSTELQVSLKADIRALKERLESVNNERHVLSGLYHEAQQEINTRQEQLNQLASAHRQATEEQIPQLRQQLSDSQLQVNTLQDALQSQVQRLDSANQKYRQATGQAIPLLKEKLNAQVERTRELQQHADMLNRELKQARAERAVAQRALTAIRKSLTYKAGLQLRAASGSFKDALKLPVRLWRLRKQVAANTGLTVEDISASAAVMLPAATEADHACLITSNLAQKPARQVRMACIMDDFTHGSYAPECELFQLTPQHWRNELEAFQPEVLFIESAWRGKDELWGSKVGHCSQELQGIVAWCREQHIPTLFWNKEDPVHFETFLTTAQLFDFVFTTDMDCIHRYKAALGHEHVYFLPFACQPAVHNPIEKYVRKDAFCFAGAYYMRYPERTRDLESFVRELPAYRPLEIYDRNHGKDDPNYQFPAQYQPHIVGTLPFSEIDKAYKGYRFAINLNSIKQSQTMFARRVYELLGSNTLTISNYSRGVRLMFGDLVVTSDSGADILRRLQQLEGNCQVDKLRLAGLRKVMSEHTYADRMNYLLEKITGQSRVRQLLAFTVVAKAANKTEASAIVAAVARQQDVQVQLILVCGKRFPVSEGNWLMQQAQLSGHALEHKALRKQNLLQLASEQDWLAAMLASDYYGPHYLLDMALATRYSNAKVIGKAAYFSVSGQADVQLHNAEQAYHGGLALAARRAVVHPQLASKLDLKDWLNNLEQWVYQAPDQQAIDCYNYCQGAGLHIEATLLEQVNDSPVTLGASLAELARMAEAIAPMQSDLEHAPWLDGTQFANLLNGQAFTWLNGHGLSVSKDEERNVSLTRNQAINCRLMGPLLEVDSTLPDGKHEYLYAKKDYELQSMQALLASNGKAESLDGLPLHLQIDPGLNLSLVVLYLDASKQRLGHEVLQPNRNLMICPAQGTHYLRFGLRVYAGGSCKIHRLVLGHLDLEPASILGQSDVLLLTNHYPSYEDLYRNGFVHSRVKAYREHSVNVDVFRLRKDQPISWHEFEDVDVITGSQSALRRMLASGRYRHVLVHFLEPDMWAVLEEFIDTIKVTVWVHGAEIHPWSRRTFNIETPEQEEIEKAKSKIRMDFWRRVLNPMPVNLHMVFVSRTFSQEVMDDIGLKLPEKQYSIIHNPINTKLFSYQEKPAEQRKKILSIRPFASRQYANDMSVCVIQELSKYEFFKEFEIRMIGDGKLFDETVAPIKDYPNVTLDRRFVTHHEIAGLHKQYGIFLCPTRWDSQGVSRDEAMSSGLVVATTAIAAIPEFVDESCAILAPPEDAKQMAAGIAALYHDENAFKRCSISAMTRVNQQTASAVIIPRELACFTTKPGML